MKPKLFIVVHERFGSFSTLIEGIPTPKKQKDMKVMF